MQRQAPLICAKDAKWRPHCEIRMADGVAVGAVARVAVILTLQASYRSAWDSASALGAAVRGAVCASP